MTWQQQFGPWAQRWGGPVPVAIVLGVLSVPPVALSLVIEPWMASEVGWQSMGFPTAVLVTVAAVIPAAVAGGLLGGLVARHRQTTGALVALAISWPTGILMLPLAASWLGATLRMGNTCLDTCMAALSDQVPWGGGSAYVEGLLVGGIFTVPPLVGLLFALISYAAVRRHRPTLAVALIVLSYGSLHVISIAYGGWVAYACLGLGAIAWSSWLAGRHDTAVPPATAR
jgi:hypothetical protein